MQTDVSFRNSDSTSGTSANDDLELQRLNEGNRIDEGSTVDNLLFFDYGKDT